MTEANFCHNCGAKVIVDENIHNFPAEPSLPTLFHVYSVVNNFRYKEIYYDRLKINWFYLNRETPQIPFEHAITNYNELSPAARVFPENHLKERFTQEEAQALKKYLMEGLKIRAVVEEYKLPIPDSEKGYRDSPAGPGTDFLPLHTKPNYNLAFKVEGIFNIKMADERIEGDDERPTVISRINPEELEKYAKDKK